MILDLILNLDLILFWNLLAIYLITSTRRQLQGCIVRTLWRGLPTMGIQSRRYLVTYVIGSSARVR